MLFVLILTYLMIKLMMILIFIATNLNTVENFSMSTYEQYIKLEILIAFIVIDNFLLFE